MSETPRRPWWRLRGVTWLAMIGVIAAVLVLNVDGRQGEYDWPRNTHVMPVWRYGWPFGFANRDLVRRITTYKGNNPVNFRYELTSRWFVNRDLVHEIFIPSPNPGPPAKIDFVAVVANLVIGLVLTIGCGWIAERRLSHARVRFRFGLAALLVAIAWTTCVWKVQSRQGMEWGWLAYVLALPVALAAIAATWFAVFDMLGIAWSRLTSRRRITERPTENPPAR